MFTILFFILFMTVFIGGIGTISTRAVNAAVKKKELAYDPHKVKMLEIENMGREWWEILGTKCECFYCQHEQVRVENTKALDEAKKFYFDNKHRLTIQERADLLDKCKEYRPETGSMVTPAWAAIEIETIRAEQTAALRQQKAKALVGREVRMFKDGVIFTRPADVPANANIEISPLDPYYNYRFGVPVHFKWTDPSTGYQMGLKTLGVRAQDGDTYDVYVDQQAKPVSTHVDYDEAIAKFKADQREKEFRERKYNEYWAKAHPPKKTNTLKCDACGDPSNVYWKSNGGQVCSMCHIKEQSRPKRPPRYKAMPNPVDRGYM